MDRFARVREFETKLGDPFDPSAPINHKTSARWDEEEHYPQEALDVLYDLRVTKEFVPVALGGNLRAYDVLLYLSRAVAHRDLSVAVTMSATAWSTLVWLGGDPKLQRQHAASILAGRTPCLAYSEEPNGADLLSSDTVARLSGDGYVVNGRKWPINRATTGHSVVLLARTGEKGDPRGLTLFWVEKSQLDPSRYRTLPRVPSLGVRGCDISGIEFEESFIPSANRLGAEGAGLEIALKGLHVTRTMCAGFSLGAVDSALRTTVRLVTTRRLYGDVLLALPPVRRTVVDAYALLQAADAASMVATRMLHVSPEQAGTISAVTKYAIPHIAEGIVGRLATIHGARFYMRDHHDWGVMQKVYRDNLVIGIFDGSSPVNLHALSTQLLLLVRHAPSSLGGGSSDEGAVAGAVERAMLASNFEVDPPLFEGARIELASRGKDDILNSFGVLADRIQAGLESSPQASILLAQLRLVRASLAKLYADITAHEARRKGAIRGSASAPALADAAERYATLYVTVSAVHAWWWRLGILSKRAPEWLILALEQLIRPDVGAGVADGEDFSALYPKVLAELLPRAETPDGFNHA